MSWPPFHPEAREEYDLVYVPVEGDILLIAFAHHKRRPGYWHKRLR